MRRVRALISGLSRAFRGFFEAPLLTLSVIAAVSLGFFMVGLVHVFAQNAGAAVVQWGGSAQMVIYLQPDAEPEQAEQIRAAVAHIPSVEHASYVSPEMAIARLRTALSTTETWRDLTSDEFALNTMPASVEVTFAPGVTDVARAHPIVERLEATPFVEEVVFIGDWADELATLATYLRYGTWGFVVLIYLVSLFLIALALRLRAGVHRDKAEVMSLFGATGAFIRGPLLIEGTLQGLVGASLAMLVLWLIFHTSADALSAPIQQVLGSFEIGFLPRDSVIIFIITGAMTGMLGSWLVTRKHGHV